ncbi:MAG: DUF4342 domain-containing protein [Deinococcales bacterium]
MDNFLTQLRRFLEPLLKQLAVFLEFSNQRQVVIRKEGQEQLRLPLTLVIVIGLLSLPSRLFPLLVIAVIVAMVLKYEFQIVRHVS